MRACPRSPRGRTIGLFVIAFIVVMVLGVIASSGLAPVPANPVHSPLTAAGDPPEAPTNLTATTLSAFEIGLSWTNPSGTLTDNHVYVYSASTCSGSPTDFDLGGVYTSYAATGLTPTTNYSFEVTASTSGVEGPPSNCVTSTTPPPGAPTGLTAASLSSHRIGLSWTNPWQTLTANTVYEYSLGCSTLLNTYIIAVAAAYTATSLTPATSYCFTVSASMSGGAGPPSASASATTRPSAPTGLTATAISVSQIDLNWTNPSGTLTANTVYEYSSACSTLVNTYVVGVVTAYATTGLKPSTTYCFKVSASTSGGAGAQSASVSSTTFNGPPPAPTGLTATTASDSEIDLAWTPSTGGGILAQGIYMFTGATCSVGGAEIVVSGSATTYAWTGLAAGTTYSFEVFDANATGNSPVSDCASATTLGSGDPAQSLPCATLVMPGTDFLRATAPIPSVFAAKAV